MAGIYIHIPFCKTKCLYCDFYSQTSLNIASEYFKAVCLELKNRNDFLENEPVETIYFGGGTPSIVPVAVLDTVFRTIFDNFSVSGDVEVTLEANPDDLSKQYINEVRSFPINRISIGIQSFSDDELRFLNRRHTANQAEKAVAACQQAGFSNISIDLMYGLPTQNLDIWEQTLQRSIDLNVQHISAYHLIYEEGTPLFEKWKSGIISPIDEELSNQLFELLMTKLQDAGFIHYEISNFSKKGFISHHNSSYWKGKKYLGVGAAAHSYNGTVRCANIADIKKYIDGASTGTSFQEVELINQDIAYNEFILTSLRTMDGLSLNDVAVKFGQSKLKYVMQQAEKHIASGLLNMSNKKVLRLSRSGIFVSDGIMADLLFLNDDE